MDHLSLNTIRRHQVRYGDQLPYRKTAEIHRIWTQRKNGRKTNVRREFKVNIIEGRMSTELILPIENYNR